MIIERRFNGPPDSANGGYTAGLVAAELTAPAAHAVQVTLRVPPPLDTPLRVARSDAGTTVEAFGPDQLVAEAQIVPYDDPPVPPVGYEEAVAAAAAYPGHLEHPFPTCYVCGPQRTDGLHIFPGPLPDGRTAAPWQVPADVSSVTMWAALDCPGGWTILVAGRPYLLGRMAAQIHAVPPADSRCVVVATVDSVVGRKAHVRSAVYADHPPGQGADQLLGQARATWIAL